jgi:hypothetical protein
MLTQHDDDYLKRLGLPYEVQVDGGMVCVTIRGWPVPHGYEPDETDLLLRLPPGFPDVQPDMYWCDPPVRYAGGGGFPPAADLMETYLGKTWQRFSRHLPAGAWIPGRDSLESYLALIRRNLQNEAPAAS